MRSIFIFFFVLLNFAGIAQTLPTGCYYVKEKSGSTVLATGKKDTVWVDTSAIITIRDFEKVKLRKTNFGYALGITLKKEGAEKFRIATAQWVQKKIAILVNGEVISAPVVVSEIPGGKLQLTNGSYSKAEMNEMKNILEKEIKKSKN